MAVGILVEGAFISPFFSFKILNFCLFVDVERPIYWTRNMRKSSCKEPRLKNYL